MPLRRAVLFILLGSIALSSLLGILVVFGASNGDLAAKAFISALVVSGASLLVMSAIAAWDLSGARLYSRVCVLASTVAMGLIISVIWIEPHREIYWKMSATWAGFAVASAHGSMLALARLAPRYHWVRTAAIAVGTLLLAGVLSAVWEVEPGRKLLRLLGALAIAETGLTLAVGALRYAGRVAPAGHGVAEVCFCPRCGKRLWLPAGELRCHHCEETFFVELRGRGELPDAVAQQVKR